ncbi:MAG: hypothetical protein VXY93_16480, partial [Pseudomonadota bacterium]|nr:hypothetical protein [Pseudomonadota bacterium]
MAIEKVSQPDMLKQFREQFAELVDSNQKMAAKIKENEARALKLQGAIETLEYFEPDSEEGVKPD